MRRWTSLVALLLLPATGCLASKGDIRLLQDEIRLSRQQSAQADTAARRADEARRAQISQLSGNIDRAIDSLRIVSQRLASFQANASGELDATNRQLVQVQALLGQATRTLQDQRAQIEAMKEQGASSGAPPASSTPPASDGAPAAAPGVPGAATLFTTGMEQLGQGNYRTARNSFDQLVSSYPTYDRVPLAQLRVGDTYMAEGNSTAADSVYQLVATRYPRAPETATALYKRGLMLWNANKKAEARTLLNKVIREFPGSDEEKLARDVLNGR